MASVVKKANFTAACLRSASVYGTFSANTLNKKSNMDNQKQELIKKLQDANNILVTVSANPSVDQLAACIGLTLFLNKMKKHATAVFSGEVPSTLQFLKPEDTLEKNTDSLRDFIVSLDKSKADKLRYKVEDNVVKIFITPYKTSITEADLDFSQGDFNVDVVVCLGVDNQQDLDQAIVAHGRILHDATVAAISIGAAGELGTLNWVEPQASSLSELTTQLANALDKSQIDGQIATSFLTGIVAETDRFSNDKTSPTTMTLSAELMAAGANQQLVASELQNGGVALKAPVDVHEAPNGADGTLEIGHNPADQGDTDLPAVTDVKPAPDGDKPGSSPSPLLASDGESTPPAEPVDGAPGEAAPASRLILQPPSMGGTLTANSEPESFDPSVDPLSLLNTDAPMLNRDPPGPQPSEQPAEPASGTSEPSPDSVALPEVQLTSAAPAPEAPASDALPDFEPLPSEPGPEAAQPIADTASEKSLSELEAAVGSPHVAATAPAPEAPVEGVDAARDAVMSAINSGEDNSLPEPAQAVGAEGYLNVQDLPDSDSEPVLDLPDPAPVNPADPAPLAASPADTPQTMPTPPSINIPPPDPTPPTSVTNDPLAAPPVPPPLPLDNINQFPKP